MQNLTYVLLTAWFLLLLLAVPTPITSGKCIHDEVQQSLKVVSHSHDLRTPSSLRSARSSVPQLTLHPLRIKAWYSSTETMSTNLDELARLNASVQDAIQIIANILKVNRIQNKLLLSRDIDKYCRSIWKDPASPNYNKCGQLNPTYSTETCLDVTIPDEHLTGYAVWPQYGNTPSQVIKSDGEGVKDADFLLYVKTGNTGKCHSEPSVIAYASYCQTDSTDRPIAGVVVFCKDRLQASQFIREKTLLTVVHELFHALGFSRDLFEKWKDCSSAPSVGVNCSSRVRVTNTDETNTVKIYTQNVIQKMKEHLASSSDELGGPLENWASAGVPSSHWEARVLQGSLMTAALGQVNLTQLDEITLAAMADTGWYEVNYSMAEKLVWGQGEGATFGLTETCADNTSQYFCQGSNLGCHFLHLDKGVCSTDNFLDGCRMFKPITNGSECWKEENRHFATDAEDVGEIYHHDSRCFFSNLTKANSTENETEVVSGRCYLHRCTDKKELQVKAEGSPWLNCTPGTAIEVPGYRGLLFCPGKHLCLSSPQPFLLSKTGTTINVQENERSTTASSNSQYTELDGKSLTVHILFKKVEKLSKINETEKPEFVEAAVYQLSVAVNASRCHFHSPLLSQTMELTLQLWEFLDCVDNSIDVIYNRIDREIKAQRITIKHNGEDYIAVHIRRLNGTSTASTQFWREETTVTIACTSLGISLMLIIVGFLIYRKHMATTSRIHSSYWPPDNHQHLPSSLNYLSATGHIWTVPITERGGRER
ncbi:leishmanolysin-like peptidase 2 [Protopterus annectens]|uniref:leishmanolysin-like peptidase 2 n=1 Tax=Protopterus annectens TaxID=7888 RepID=UPI001CFC0130|nr:leishmanolysin-like peptidase 2 [Protopterus annectens]